MIGLTSLRINGQLLRWLAKAGTGMLYIEPGNPWENGYCESFNGKLRDECLAGEIFYLLKEAQAGIEKCRLLYNTLRPDSALGYRPPHQRCSPRTWRLFDRLRLPALRRVHSA